MSADRFEEVKHNFENGHPNAGRRLTDLRYGSKCHICTHLDGSTHDRDEAWFGARPTGLQCRRCSFCQDEALGRLLRELGMDFFDPEVRAATKAFMEGREHPLIDRLRAEMVAIDAAASAETGEEPK